MNRLAFHTITTKPWGLEKSVENFLEQGISGITVWQDALENFGVREAANILERSPIEVISYCRGGFFPSLSGLERQQTIEKNKQLIDDASLIGAPLMVLVCGAAPGLPLEKSRDQIRHGIEQILPTAIDQNVKLAIEPLHPLYADTRSAINTLTIANDMVEDFDDEFVGVAIDVYHVWWEPGLKAQIKRCAQSNSLLAFHICDWKVPTVDLLNDRGIMGEGCIPIKEISDWVDETGFGGMREVEIFSNRYWEMDQHEYLDRILEAYRKIYES